MQQKRYEINTGNRFLTAEFISHGINGAITKQIVFEKTDLEGFYNLAFGDKLPGTNDFDDTTVTNNGDTQMVLATVAYVIDSFTKIYPGVWVYVKGSSASRNRLYQMGINKFFTEISNALELIAETEEDWQPYTKGKNYLAFAIRRKI